MKKELLKTVLERDVIVLKYLKQRSIVGLCFHLSLIFPNALFGQLGKNKNNSLFLLTCHISQSFTMCQINTGTFDMSIFARFKSFAFFHTVRLRFAVIKK